MGACFTKVFNGCPLKIHCAVTWILPKTRGKTTAYITVLKHMDGAQKSQMSQQFNKQVEKEALEGPGLNQVSSVSLDPNLNHI